MKSLIRKINKAQEAKQEFDSKCDTAANEFLKYVKFETPEDNFFHIEYQPSDGMVLADYYSNVYALTLVLDYLWEHGSFTSYDQLKQFGI